MHAAFNLLTLTNNLAGRQFIMRDSIKRDNAKTNDKNRTAQTKSDTSSSDLSDLAVNTNSAAAMLRMQQTRGNQAVLRMLNKQGPSSHAAVQRSPLQRDDDDSTSTMMASPEAVSTLSSWASSAYNAVADTASGAYNTVADTASSAYNTAADMGTSAYNTVADTASNVYNTAADMGSSAYNTVANTASSAYDTASQGVSDAASWVGGKADAAAKWGGIDTDRGFMNGVASVPGSRISNMFWDGVGLIPEVGAAISTGVDLGESFIRSGQAAYNVATGDLDTADLRQKQATEDLQGAAVDATGLIPGYGTGAGLMSLAYDAATSDPRDSAANQQIELAKGMIDQGNPFSPNPEWTAKNEDQQRKKVGVGLPPDAEFSQDQVGKDTIVLTTNGKQQTYVWDQQQRKYLRGS